MSFARFIIAAAVCAFATTPANAERIVSSLATHQVFITSQFIGLDLVLFGSVERDAATVPHSGAYDLVVTVTGPKESLVTRRKDRILGIWVNVESRDFIDVPSYLAVLSTRPVRSLYQCRFTPPPPARSRADALATTDRP